MATGNESDEEYARRLQEQLDHQAMSIQQQEQQDLQIAIKLAKEHDVSDSEDSDITLEPEDPMVHEISVSSSDDEYASGTHNANSTSITSKTVADQECVHTISDSDSDNECTTVVKQKDINSAVDNSSSQLKKRNKNKLVPMKRQYDLSDSDENDSNFGSKKKLLKPGLDSKNTSKSCNTETMLQRTDKIESSSSDTQSAVHEDTRPVCQYGKDCYRKNPAHFSEFQHPDKNIDSQLGEKKRHGNSSTSVAKSSSSIYSVLSSSPFGFLLTHVTGIDKKFNMDVSIDIKDILSPKMGNLQASAQFNYCHDIPWLMHQYPKEFRSKPLLLVHGAQRESKSELDAAAMDYPNIKLCQAKLDIMYGTHHTKMMLLLYDEGLRVVIHTANLVPGDWYQKTQGVWISPVFPKMSGDCNAVSNSGDSKTNFKKDLLEYLTVYKSNHFAEWIKHIKEHDMSSARVFIISSVPGRHVGDKMSTFGHMKLRKILTQYGPKAAEMKTWPIIGQFSSIGSLGATKENWLCGEWLTSLSSSPGGKTLGTGMTNIKLIFPSKENVRLSLEGYSAGGALPYSIQTAKKQMYLQTFLHEWKCEKLGRSEACPHIKTYARVEPSSSEQIAWFLVTSANLSKAAWGALEKNQSQLMIRSYELGVLFLPQNFDSEETFDIKCGLLPYDVPLTPYGKEDRPWMWDIPYTDKPDTHGQSWIPSR